ncbi:MAG TPA: alpha-mannosidase [Oscillatoriales cyanobacterium M4454_W2019_049]|nr:alpha-mannosidase [Oscillatoriales cyanobacterium M4454_W2019_049]
MTNPLKNLRQLTRIEAIKNWRGYEGELPIATATDRQKQSIWQQADLNAKRHIPWSPGYRVLWLGQTFVIPPDICGYDWSGLTVRIALQWWAESAQVFVNGSLVQEGDLFDGFTRICLSPSAEIGDSFNVALRLVSPGHDDGALVRSTLIAEHPENPHLDPGFVADELEILARWEGEDSAILKSAINLLRISALPGDRSGFDYSILQVYQLLQEQFPYPPATLYLLGHAHLDMAWLWSVSETWKAAERTFTSALSLQTDFPELIFSHSTPALYAWMETHRPDLFSQIQAGVKTGNWEVAAGMWVEPELNIISGESIVRQVLYGQRYTRDKFGSISPVVWLPDSFGFTWQLPQILQQGGIDYFVTQKLRWNDTTEFPYDCFWWQSPDGTRIFSLMSALIGQDIEPVKMAAYAVEFQRKTGSDRSLWLPGVGDHGGGPTRDMLEVARRWQDSPVFPQMEFKTAAAYLRELNQQLGGETLPIWNDDLYLEFHRGCYTAHADQKQANRRSERLLYQAELFSTLATQTSGAAYPQSEIEAAWKRVLFNQFHDILPGSSIPEVYEDANRDWQEVERVGSQLLESALTALCQQITLPQPPQPDAIAIALFNPLNWGRSELVSLSLPDTAASYRVYDLEGRQLPTQLAADGMLLFPATDVPSIGYRVVWLCPETAETLDFSLDSEAKREKFVKNPSIHSSIAEKSPIVQNDSLDAKTWVLENELIRVTVDGKTGNLSSFFDKLEPKEILNSSGGNQLQAFQDSGQYWDAWNIDPNYEQHPLPPPTLESIAWRERGELRWSLRVIRRIGQSEFCQDYILETGSPILKMATTVDWQERHVLVKAAFGFNFAADFATYEIPCAAIDRTTKPQTDADRAKWEVSALHWADLTANGYGVSLLNDSKYGYDAKPNSLRLSLLRGSTWPDPNADLGQHHFTYAIYPHAGNWQKAHTVRRGYELNQPLLTRTIDRSASTSQLPPVRDFLNLSAENLVVMALKPAEDDPHSWILRCYECHGKTAELNLGEKWAIVESVNLLEEVIDNSLPARITISPWKIATFKLQKRDS